MPLLLQYSNTITIDLTRVVLGSEKDVAEIRLPGANQTGIASIPSRRFIHSKHHSMYSIIADKASIIRPAQPSSLPDASRHRS